MAIQWFSKIKESKKDKYDENIFRIKAFYHVKHAISGDLRVNEIHLTKVNKVMSEKSTFYIVKLMKDCLKLSMWNRCDEIRYKIISKMYESHQVKYSKGKYQSRE